MKEGYKKVVAFLEDRGASRWQRFPVWEFASPWTFVLSLKGGLYLALCPPVSRVEMLASGADKPACVSAQAYSSEESFL